MKNMAKLSVTTLACLVLAACGGGGGGSSQPTTNNSPVVINPNPSTPPATNDNSTGGVFMLSGEDDNVTLAYKKLASANKFEQQIVVDGKVVTIAFPGIGGNGWTHINTIHTCCNKYRDVRFGHIVSADPSENDYFFYNGNTTQVMPTGGIAKYNGDFIFDSDAEAHADLENSELTGNAAFEVDFANKTVVGNLTSPHVQPIEVKADISGNGFKGTARSASFQTTADLNGKFYGTNAKELGGVFADKEITWGGAFGATR